MTSPPGGGCAGRRPAGRLQDTTRGRQLDERPWYTGFFDDDYLRIFGPVLAEERTAGEVNGVVELLGLAPGAGVLDLCCGQGRHAVPLAQLGYRVTGLDLSRTLLGRAAATARAQGRRVGLVEADMRRLPFADGSFDAVVNLFHAFGYLEDEAQDELVLAEVARVLAPGGCFLQEVANREALVRGWHDSEVARHDDGLLVLQERALDLRTSRDVVRYTLVDADGPRATREASIRLYTLTELEAMLGRAGLELLEVFGDLDAGPLELDSSFVVTLSGRAGKGIS
ncbi:MAG TPA: class I SAM-dependent methyltransferase [Actinomycetes bacterium]|nr:class I SAM-dependent methyltransferase [Actinomycetes bacterium]